MEFGMKTIRSIIFSLTAAIAIALLSGCNSSSNNNSGVEGARLNVVFSVDDLELSQGDSRTFNVTVTDPAGTPVAGALVELSDSSGLLSFDAVSIYADAVGSAEVTVSMERISINGDTGEITAVAYDDPQSDGVSANLEYTVNPWDRNLLGGSIDFSATSFSGAERSKEFDVPEGITLQAGSYEIMPGITLEVTANKITVLGAGDEITDAGGAYNPTHNIIVTELEEPITVTVNIKIGDGTAGHPFPVGSAAELAYLETSVSGQYFLMDDDITVEEGESVTPVTSFAATFDGGGHSMAGLDGKLFDEIAAGGRVTNLNLPGLSATFINTLNGGTLDNITVTDAVSAMTHEVSETWGMLVNTINGNGFSVRDIYLKGSITHINGSGSTVTMGLIAGYVGAGGKIDNITVEGSVNFPEEYSVVRFGTLAGAVYYPPTITEDIVISHVAVTLTAENVAFIGGLIGNAGDITISSTTYTMKLSDSYADLNIKNGTYVGGLINYLASPFDTEIPVIERCYTRGTIEGGYVGGLIYEYYNGDIRNCYSTADLKGRLTVGGIAVNAHVWGNDEAAVFTNNYTTGSITSTYEGGTSSINYPASGIFGRTEPEETWVNMSKNIALNPSITAELARRVLYDHSGTNSNYMGEKMYDNNYAFAGMLINGTAADEPSKGLDKENGADVTLTQLADKTFYTGLGFDEAVWDLNFDAAGRTYKLPILKGVGGDQDKQPAPKIFQ
jgi:hypothetical protein